jgi:four helix bundle protein
MGYQSYKDLEIYKLAHDLAIEMHEMSLTLPRYELYEEGSQIRRSSKAVSSNLVEGFGRRRYKNEFIKFLIYALASCDETREHLDLLFKTKSFSDAIAYQRFSHRYDVLGRMLNKFIQSVQRNHLPPKNSLHVTNVSTI